MKHAIAFLGLMLLLAPAGDARARRSWASPSRKAATSRPAKSPSFKAPKAKTPRTRIVRPAKPPAAAPCATCARDSKGRIARSAAARAGFQKSHPCPSTGKGPGACPGYVIDHIVPLKRGGADSPHNMQWQTTAAAKAKDRIE